MGVIPGGYYDNHFFLGNLHASWRRFVDGIAPVAAREHINLVIQVGDFGFFKQYAPHPLGAGSSFRLAVPTYVIDGNHEDHAWLSAQRANGAVRSPAAPLISREISRGSANLREFYANLCEFPSNISRNLAIS